jgi:hypothetical protein
MSKQPRETLVLTSCAWCNTLIGASTSPWTGEEALTTHGLCADCLRRFRPRQDPWQATAPVPESSQEAR